MSCNTCQLAQGQGIREKCGGIDAVDECPTGEVPKLNERNKKFQRLLVRTLPGLFDGFGGVSFYTIDYIMNLYSIGKGQRPIIHDKFLQVIQAIQEQRSG